ncbi:hypothetical protein [Streptomonospora salina]|uniref:Uncharacterized protein n=1 Tax=Streptomonospora salina TaxID=104205 RepID=A0A841EA10_9ACTN|nr:hypothetical protein [Streptomonospora salina]MBB6000857.1 hypothetical protein [Streptomonospora salina]
MITATALGTTGAALGLAFVVTVKVLVGRWAARVERDIQAAMWGVRTDGRLRPRCERCLHPTVAQVAIPHTEGCLFHVPDTPAELAEET